MKRWRSDAGCRLREADKQSLSKPRWVPCSPFERKKSALRKASGLSLKFDNYVVNKKDSTSKQVRF